VAPIRDAVTESPPPPPPASPRLAVAAPELALRLPMDLPPPAAPGNPYAQAADIEVEPAPQAPALGVIRGLVSDESTQAPLAGARIRLEISGADAVVVESDARGRFELPVPLTPEFFAISASRVGYTPGSVNVPAAEVRDGVLEQDFALRPLDANVLALEPEPRVHHLGNDAWEGAINSQFQRQAEGRRFIGLFELSDEQLEGAESVTLSLLAKGVQCPHRLLINGALLRRRLDRAPADGSFGRFETVFGAELLRPGLNTLEIQAISCTGDLDDFEFVNIQFSFEREITASADAP
jgi:hypothetical protein